MKPHVRGQLGWDLLLILSLIGAIVALWLSFLAPKPKSTSHSKPGNSVREIETSAQKIEDQAELKAASIESRTWRVSAETLASELLAKVNGIAASHHITVNGFRAGRSIAATTLQEVPFVIVLEGAFLDVMAAVKELERPGSKLAVSQLKVTAKDDPDIVTASVSVTGFLAKEAQ